MTANTCSSDRHHGDPPGALVLGGAHGSLAVVRSLGRHGIPVWFVTDDHLIARFSRFTRRSLSWPEPGRPDGVGSLLGLARDHHLEGWVLIPCADAPAQVVSQHHAELASVFRLTTAPWEIARYAFDKQCTYERAATLGIDHPRSYHARDFRDVVALDCRFPVVLKPSIRERTNAFTLAKAWRVNDRATLLMRYRQAAALVGERAIVLQDLIPGGGATQFSYAALWDRGRPVASLTVRRTRQYPVDFGYTSTFVETMAQPAVSDAACRFLHSLDYSGLVEVEFKYDARDHRYKLLDVNARPWTWIGLGRIAGVDFPYLLWRLVTGDDVPATRAPAHARWMHLSRDVVSACQEMVAGTLPARQYLESFRRPLAFAAFAKDDPLPGLMDIPLVAARVLTRRLPAIARTMARKGT